MKRSLLLGAIAATALIATGQAQSLERTQVGRPVATTEHTAVAPSRTRSAVRTYNRGGRYYYGGNYYRGSRPYYYRGPSVAVGVGGYYGYPYDYGYPYGYAYDYPYGYGNTYAYDNEYPYSTNGPVTRTVTTTRSRDLAYNDNLVAAVQERLARAGYYHGAIDAVAGPETRSAIAQWEADHGMTADGLIDEQTLHAMGVS